MLVIVNILKDLEYVSSKRKIDFSKDVTINEDVTLGKERGLPLTEKKGDDDILEGPYVPKFEKDIVDDPVEPTDPLDRSPSDPPTRKIPLWISDNLQDSERYVPLKRTFRESKNPR